MKKAGRRFHRIFRAVFVAALALAITGANLAPAAAVTWADVNELKDEANGLDAEKKELQAKLDALRPLYPLPDRGKQPVSRLLLRRILHRALQGPPLRPGKGTGPLRTVRGLPLPEAGEDGGFPGPGYGPREGADLPGRGGGGPARLAGGV